MAWKLLKVGVIVENIAWRATASSCVCTRKTGHLVIDVLDTGVGLPDDRERLTEPYMTTRVRGTGLGLAIVKKIVEEHMGEIAFLDRAGGGTHVRISFDTDKLAALATGEARNAMKRNTMTARMLADGA